jgi:exopolysaccharide biosynthesis polyprenyl glycosylphosphotransferase
VLNRRQLLRSPLFLAADVFVLTLCFHLALELRQRLPWPTPSGPLADQLWLLYPALLLSLLSLQLHGLYRSDRPRSGLALFLAIFRSACWSFLALLAALYCFKVNSISRVVAVEYAIMQAPLLWGYRVLVSRTMRRLRRLGWDRPKLLLLGSAGRLREVLDRLEQADGPVYDLVGCLVEGDEAVGADGCPEPELYLGTLADLEKILHSRAVDEVLVASGYPLSPRLLEALRTCEEEGKVVHLRADWYQPRLARIVPSEIFGLPAITLSSLPDRNLEFVLKRLLDLAAAGVMLLAISPLLGLIALAVKLGSHGPVLFRQARTGQNGRPFTCLKFRTMAVHDAALKAELRASRNEMDGPVFKIALDPRVTPLGSLLRRLSLDELPQLWNVLRGDMSLVGPRPLPCEEVAAFPERGQRRRHLVRPGLTCFWQIRGRNTISFREWMKLDLQYIDNWSLFTDLVILLRTIPALLTRKGAV